MKTQCSGGLVASAVVDLAASLGRARPVSTNARRRMFSVLAILIMALSLCPSSTAQQTKAAQTFQSLFSFDTTDGTFPQASLMQATDGNLYGTTQQGGTDRVGTVYRITPQGTLTTLHSFIGPEGYRPNAGAGARRRWEPLRHNRVRRS